MTVRVVVIGYGFLGKFHVEKVLLCTSQATLVAIVDALPAARQTAQEKYPDIKVVSSIEEISDEDYDAAIIVTQTSTHKQLLDYLIERRKHILCEKPMTANYNDALIVQKAWKNNASVIQVGHSERYHRCFDRNYPSNIWNLAGDILSDENALVQFRRLALHKGGRGMDVSIEKDIMVHDIDLAVLLFRVHEYPTDNIQVHTTKMLTPPTNLTLSTDQQQQIHDHVNVRLTCPNRATIEFEVGRGFHSETRKIVMWSRYGTVTINLLKKKIDIVRNGQPQTVTYPGADHLLLEQQDFYASILQLQDVKVTPDVAVNVLKILDVIERNNS